MKVIIGLIVWFVMFLGASKVFGQVVVKTGSGGLYVAHNASMQPFGVGPEDEVRAMDVAQPTYPPQVTLNGAFVQPVGLNR